MNLNNQTTVNVQEKSNLIWAIADLIRDFYKAHEYGKVILLLECNKENQKAIHFYERNGFVNTGIINIVINFDPCGKCITVQDIVHHRRHRHRRI